MKALKEHTSAGRRRSNAIRIVAGNCIMVGLVTLGGCSFLDAVTTRAAPADDRVQLSWEDGTLSLHRGELENYTCIDDLPLQCESVSGKSLCWCPRR